MPDLTAELRRTYIDQMVRSYDAMPKWVRNSLIHAMCVPNNNPATGKPWESFKEMLEAASDDSILLIRQDIKDNGDLID